MGLEEEATPKGDRGERAGPGVPHSPDPRGVCVSSLEEKGHSEV